MQDRKAYLEQRLKEHLKVCTRLKYGRWVAAVDEFYIAHARDEEILRSTIRDWGSNIDEVPIIYVEPKRPRGEMADTSASKSDA